MAKMAIIGENQRKSHFVGRCTEEPKSRFRASSNWHLPVSLRSEILYARFSCPQTSICAGIGRSDQNWPSMRGAQMAILTKISFRAKIGDFQKLPIWRCSEPPIALKGAKFASLPRKTPRTTVWRILVFQKFFEIFAQFWRYLSRIFSKIFDPKISNKNQAKFRKSQKFQLCKWVWVMGLQHQIGTFWRLKRWHRRDLKIRFLDPEFWDFAIFSKNGRFGHFLHFFLQTKSAQAENAQFWVNFS